MTQPMPPTREAVPVKVIVHNVLAQADRLEDLGAAIALGGEMPILDITFIHALVPPT